MARRPEIGNIQLYPKRPLTKADKNGYVLKFYCPIQQKRIRRNAGTRDGREARRILRECRERLFNGKYIESGGAITQDLAPSSPVIPSVHTETNNELAWQECFERYYAHQKVRVREKSLEDTTSRINIAERILEGRREDLGLGPGGGIAEFATLESMEYLQDRLLEGDECRYEWRSPNTVNSMVSAVMAFIRYCHKHGWIDRVPPISKLPVSEVMKGRPITEDEFIQMLEAVSNVVGQRPSDSWKHVMNVIWETGFRVADVMDFSWDDAKRIHPIWPTKRNEHPTISIPSSQKNKKSQEIPILPGLEQLLKTTPTAKRRGWVVNPRPKESATQAMSDSFKPTEEDLRFLVKKYSNSAIARACNVSETAVRKWLRTASIDRTAGSANIGHHEVPNRMVATLRDRDENDDDDTVAHQRLGKEKVSRVIAEIGKSAKIIVQDEDRRTAKRLKYASAHDIRRGFAKRLINAGVSAETLKLILRHEDFRTTEKFYGATRAVQSAADEIRSKCVSSNKR